MTCRRGLGMVGLILCVWGLAWSTSADGPPAAVAPRLDVPVPDAAEPPQPARRAPDPAVEELLRLREQLGSPLRGTLLEGDDAEAFRESLERAAAGADERPTLRQPAELGPPPGYDNRPIPPVPAAMSPSSAGDGGAAASLRVSARQLELLAGDLEAAGRPARAEQLRRLARRLRSEADVIAEEAVAPTWSAPGVLRP